jgi:glycosyltransferase involved in cell wall biosynthesis
MRIAQVAPPWYPIPPERYGGIEQIVSWLTDALVDRGHDVTLFATRDSKTKASLRGYYRAAQGPIVEPLQELPHLVDAYLQAEDFDIVHDHTFFGIGPAMGALLKNPAFVHTTHVPVTARDYLLQTYEGINDRTHFVAVSNAQRLNTPTLKYAATIYNGIPVDAWPFSKVKDDYLLFVGRMSPQKGPHLAITAARALGRRLLMGVKMHEGAERDFFEAEVKGLLTPDIEILGELNFTEKLAVYSNAACTLMPIQWPEPFGLVVIESLACGTPVVALRNGAMDEIIQNNVTGVVADTMDEFIEGIERAGEFDPAACRRSVEARFSVETMTNGYESLYRSLKPNS